MTNDVVTAPVEAVVRQDERPLLCCRCYDDVPVLYVANCQEKPDLLAGAPLGMYHCPDCGAMVVAGMPHPPMCKQCIDRAHPAFDEPPN